MKLKEILDLTSIDTKIYLVANDMLISYEPFTVYTAEKYGEVNVKNICSSDFESLELDIDLANLEKEKSKDPGLNALNFIGNSINNLEHAEQVKFNESLDLLFQLVKIPTEEEVRESIQKDVGELVIYNKYKKVFMIAEFKDPIGDFYEIDLNKLSKGSLILMGKFYGGKANE